MLSCDAAGLGFCLRSLVFFSFFSSFTPVFLTQPVPWSAQTWCRNGTETERVQSTGEETALCQAWAERLVKRQPHTLIFDLWSFQLFVIEHERMRKTNIHSIQTRPLLGLMNN